MYDKIQEDRSSQTMVMQETCTFLDVALQLDTLAAGAGQAYRRVIQKTFINGDKNMTGNYMVKNYDKMDSTEFSTLAGEISVVMQTFKAKESTCFYSSESNR